MDAEHKEFRVLTPFSLKEAEVEDKTDSRVLRIAGYANWSGTDDLGRIYTDLVGDVVLPRGVDAEVWSANPQILWQHDRDQTIGRGLMLEKRDDGVYLEAEIHADAMDPRDFYRIKNGLVSFFSIGFRTLSGEWRDVDGEEVWFITRCLLLEVSVVSIPANSRSAFSTMKSLGDGQGIKAEAAERPATKKGQPMKVTIKHADILSEADVTRLKELGVDTEAQVEFDLVTLIKQVCGAELKAVTERLDALTDEVKRFSEEPEVKQEDGDGEEPAAEAADAEGAEPEQKQEQDGAHDDAGDAADDMQEKELAEELKDLADVVAEIKAALA